MKKIKAEKLKNKNKSRASKKPEKTVPPLTLQEPKETMQQLPPLLQGGTKPLLIDQEDFSPKPRGTAPPCLDAKTGKEARFLLADLQSELIPLSFSNMDRVLSSLEVMGVKTIEARVPVSYTHLRAHET